MWGDVRRCNEINKRFLCIFSHSNSFLSWELLELHLIHKNQKTHHAALVHWIHNFFGVFLIIFCLLKFLIGNWIDMRSIFSYAFLIHSECMRAAFPFSLYFSFILLSLRKCTANRNVQKFISGLWFPENENPFFPGSSNGISHFSHTNWFMY